MLPRKQQPADIAKATRSGAEPCKNIKRLYSCSWSDVKARKKRGKWDGHGNGKRGDFGDGNLVKWHDAWNQQGEC